MSVHEAGTGPTVIALHGGPGFRDYLAPDLEPLTSSFRVISYDQRGSGHSTVVTEPPLLTAPAFVADLCARRPQRCATFRASTGRSWAALARSTCGLSSRRSGRRRPAIRREPPVLDRWWPAEARHRAPSTSPRRPGTAEFEGHEQPGERVDRRRSRQPGPAQPAESFGSAPDRNVGEALKAQSHY